MVRVVGIDHLVIRVGDYQKSKAFYGRLFEFLGFKVLDEYADAIGWTNGKTRFWIGPADAEGRKRKYRVGDIGFHHYAFELRSRKDVDALQAFVEKLGAPIVDPAAEYYDDYYAVFFLDPDGLKLEGMKWGEARAKAARKRARLRRAGKGGHARPGRLGSVATGETRSEFNSANERAALSLGAHDAARIAVGQAV
jgi:catechol 2,3-dioxygenase-like lactoylglutathione lyase family enzyme